MIIKITHFIKKSRHYELTIIDIYYNQKILKLELDSNTPVLYTEFNKQKWLMLKLDEVTDKILEIELIPDVHQKELDIKSLKLRGGSILSPDYLGNDYEETDQKQNPKVTE